MIVSLSHDCMYHNEYRDISCRKDKVTSSTRYQYLLNLIRDSVQFWSTSLVKFNK